MHGFGMLVSTLCALASPVAANPIWLRTGDFASNSPPPKVSHINIFKRAFLRPSAWNSGFIGNTVNSPASYGTSTGSTGATGPPSSYGQTGLTSYQQNGYSSWGTFNQSSLPKYASYGGHSSTGYPWGSITTTNANPYTSAPKTGSVRSYSFTVAACDIRPDGVTTKGAICINGQFPGPLIEANYGDTIQVKVTNGLKNEGTSMHWHGFLQTNSNGQDGVPGVTQCPIAPGASMTYSFKAELYGSTWYHTHYSAQYAGGAVGPMVIYGPSNQGADIDIGPVMLNDWYRDDYMTSIRGLMNPLSQGGPKLPLANSNLINGKMRYPCSKANVPCVTADYARFNFTVGKNHRLRLINTGSNAVQKFSIDGHKMQVIANDFMPIKPYNTSMIALGVGQRADVIVYGSGKKGDVVWMRSNMVACSVNDGQLTEALGIIYYPGADPIILPSAPPNSGPAASTDPRSCSNDPLTQTEPTFPLVASTADAVKTFNISMKSNGTHMLMYMGDQSFRANFNDPVLSHALTSRLLNIDPQRNVWNVGPAKTMRAIIYNYDDAPHPIHLHGHNMQILNVGMGKWDNSVVRSMNPQRRDVQVMPPGSASTPSYLVVQWNADNPGVWPLHCHFAWHSSMGLVINVVETPASILKTLGSGATFNVMNTCNAWNMFTQSTKVLVTGIDSGL